MPALRAEQRGDPAGREDPLRVLRAQGEFELAWVAPDHPPHQVDLLQGGGHGRLTGQRRGHVHRPELGADPARGQPRQVGLGEADRLAQVRAVQAGAPRFAQRPGQVIVPIDQGHLAEQLARPLVRLPSVRPVHGMDSTAAPRTRSLARSARAWSAWSKR